MSEKELLEALQAALVKIAEHGVETARLSIENERLRGLIKAAERSDFTGECADRCCPWCAEERTHHESCPAFTPSGEVK